MTNIAYTRQVAIGNSSLVDEVYYNENTRDLYVDLDGPVYKYRGVPVEVVDKFEAAASAGAFYNTEIKRVFGPGDDLGHWEHLDYDAEDVEVKTTGLTVYNAGNIPAQTVYHAGGIVSATTPNTVHNTFSLKPFPEGIKVEGVEREYAVTFEVIGILDHKTHTLKASSVDEAVQTVLDLGKMLGLNFIVREVCIRFE